MRHLNKLAASLMLLIAPMLQAEETSPAEKLVVVLGQLQYLHATFEQQTDKPGTQTGEIWLRKPRQFRIEASSPMSQTIVSDGSSMWTYDRDLEQVIINPLSRQLAEMPVLLFADDPEEIPRQYDIEFFEDETRQHYLLTPLDTTGLLTTMVLTFENDLPARITVGNAMQEQTIVKLSSVSVTAIENGLFSFDIPPEVDVIDDRLDNVPVRD